MRILDSINSPFDLKKLSIEDLPKVAQEIRDEIIETVSCVGGHLASSLGAVELAIAIHYCLDTPKDKLIWDVGHQAYAHKLLTGRRAHFKTLRQFGGLSGFPNKNESPYDTFTTGHGSTSISTALGLACSRDLKDEDYKVVAVIGDASLGGGMAFEALNHAGHIKKRIVVILNDNEMSISRSVGALSRYLNRIITAPIYNRIRKDVENLLKRVPRFGFRVIRAARRLEEGLKNLLVPGILFEELGFRYFGPIDGHNINVIIGTLKNLLKLDEPVFLHVITKKGKGYLHAESLPEKFHGVGSFDITTGTKKCIISEEVSRPADLTFTPLEKAADREESSLTGFTKAFSEKIVELAKTNEKIVTITAAMPEGTGLERFAKEFPERFFDVGMAEAHAVGFGAGLAKGGLIPVVCIYSTFLQRSYDQIVHDVSLQNLHVVLMLDRSGLVGEDGPTHHGIFDIAYLRSLPNLVIMAPRDEIELTEMLEFATRYDGPIAIRYPRGGSFYSKRLESERFPREEIRFGCGEVLKEGRDLAIFALGYMVYPCLEAGLILRKEGIDCAIINARFVKPLDKELILELSKRVGMIFTAEEGILEGGFGSSILELFEKEFIKIPVKRIGLDSRFFEHGPRELLLDKYGLSSQKIADFIKSQMRT